MATIATDIELVEYRVIVVSRDLDFVLALSTLEGYRLPRVSIPPKTRPAKGLCKAVQLAWGLKVFVLDFLPNQVSSSVCVIAEFLVPSPTANLMAVHMGRICATDLSEAERAWVTASLAGGVDSPFSRIGWIDEASAWLEGVARCKLASKDSIEQHNAGGAFALLRFRTEDGLNYWLKATGHPHMHELPITSLLAELAKDHLPALIATKPEWNAWLMGGDGIAIAELPTEPMSTFQLLSNAIESLASLQIKTVGFEGRLIKAGAFDQSEVSFRDGSEELFEYLKKTMSLQSSNKVPRIENSRLSELREVFNAACACVSGLEIPVTIVHGDMNLGNILSVCGPYQFIDWCEAYVGNPLICLQHMLLFNQVANIQCKRLIDQLLKARYRKIFQRVCDPSVFDKGLVFMPLLAAGSALFGRGSWHQSWVRDEPGHQAYVRSLTRQLDRAAREPTLLEALGS